MSTLFDKFSWGFEEVKRPEPEVTENGIVPRDYQEEAIRSTFRSFESDPGAIVRLPTGTGKTIVGALIANRWLGRGDDHRVMVIAHERQLIWQFAQEIEDVLGIEPGIEMADRRVPVDPLPQITIASRATLLDRKIEDEDGEEVSASRVYKFCNERYKWLVIWDEAHKHAYGLRSVRHIVDWFDQGKDNRRLGLTATPERTDKRSLEKMFPAIASDYRLFDITGGPCAVRDGYAVPYDQRFVEVDGVDFKNIRQVAGDFDRDQLAAAIDQQQVLESLCQPTVELVGDRSTLIFSVNRAMAQNVARHLKARGKTAEWLDGTIKDEDRQRTYAAHQRGDFQFLSVCGLCREGYNDPGIQAVAVFRPTKSRPLAEQMKGRGCRPLKGVIDNLFTAEERVAAIAASDKPDCLIIDMVGVSGLADCATTASIYGAGMPDEVIDRANKKVSEGETDIPTALEEADKEIKRERAEREAQAEAERRARLEAEVRWNERQVNAGHGATADKPKKRGARMPFGKHRGKHISDVPTKYICWLVTSANLRNGWFKASVNREWNARLDAMDHRERDKTLGLQSWIRNQEAKQQEQTPAETPF